MQKFCKGCRHYNYAYEKCLRNLSYTTDLVSGRKYQTGYLSTNKERYSKGYEYCGELGQFWEQKDS